MSEVAGPVRKLLRTHGSTRENKLAYTGISAFRGVYVSKFTHQVTFFTVVFRLAL